MTYSVVARDARTGELGVACQSHFFAAGSVVNWAEAGVGAIATQSFLDVGHGPRGLALVRDGASAGGALRTLLDDDPKPEIRQVAVVDAEGGLAVHTGEECVPARGSRVGPSYLVQGNMLAGERVLDAMDEAMAAEGDLAERMLGALRAGEAAGGDLRGSQAAGLLVVSGRRGAQPWNEVSVDLRVDDAADPIGELTRLLRLRRLSARINELLFAEGLVIGPYAEPGPGVTEAALQTLADVAGQFGDANLEAEIWRCVLLTRSGRVREAERSREELVRRRPELATFFANLEQVAILRRG